MDKNGQGLSGGPKRLLFAVLAYSVLSVASSFGQDGSGGQIGTTGRAEETADPLPVILDINPGSCENPLNVRSRGKTPAAILGSSFLDVEEIDPLSLLINGKVVALKWSTEDVAGPPAGLTDDVMLSPEALTADPICTVDGADGFPDLVLKFDTKDIVEVLFGDYDSEDGADDDGRQGRGRGRTKKQPLEEAEEAIITLTGYLTDGTPIIGRDVVRIKRKGKPDFDGDGDVGFGDFIVFAERFGVRKGHAKFEIAFDLDDSGDIGFGDFLVFVQAFVEAVQGFADSQGTTKPVVVDASGESAPAVALRPQTDSAPDLLGLTVELSLPEDISAYQLVLLYDPTAVELVSAAGPAGSVYKNELENSEQAVAVQEELEPGMVLLADAFRSDRTMAGELRVVDLTFRVLDPQVPVSLEIAEVFVADLDGLIRTLPGTLLGNLRALPAEHALRRNYPNPFNPSTQIDYQLPEAGQVSLTIYNALGQQVRTLVRGEVQAGFHQVAWDGEDAFGRRVASGIYFVRMEAPGFRQVRKMMLIK